MRVPDSEIIVPVVEVPALTNKQRERLKPATSARGEFVRWEPLEPDGFRWLKEEFDWDLAVVGFPLRFAFCRCAMRRGRMEFP